MNFKKFYLILIFLSMVFFSFGQTKKKLTIGVVIDGYWYRNDEVMEMFKKEIFDLLAGEYDVKFSKDNIIVGDWTAQSAKAGLDRWLKDPNIDVVLAMGMLASNEVCRRPHLEKPVIAPFVVDALLQGLPRKGKGTGIKNLNYLVSLHSVAEGLNYLKKLVDFDTVVFLSGDFIKKDYPMLVQRGESIRQIMGIDTETIWVGKSADEVISKLRPDMQAIYMPPLIHISRADFKRIVAELNRLKIPSFSHMGDTDIDDGVLASIHRRVNFLRLARRVALNIQRILMGEDAGTLPVEFRTETQLTINMETARQIGVYPTWDVVTEAELVNEEETVGETLTLMDAVNRAIKSNLELLSKQIEFRAGKQDIRLAAANLLPHIDISGLGVKIDKDRASASFGTAAENTLSGSATLTQLIFSEPASANLSIQKHLQRSRDAELNQVTLDISLSAAAAYLNVLRAKALERVQKDNLKKTRSNLQLARVRQSLGAGSASEVYRWDAQYAASQIQFENAQAQREIAEIHLNRVLHRPLRERFNITDAGLDSPFLTSKDERFFSFIDNQWTLNLFTDFMAEYGVKHAPELAQLDAVIAAKKRYLKSTRHKFYLPTIALQAGVTNYFSKTGSGTETSDISNLFPTFNMAQLEAIGSLFPERPDDLDWNIGVQLSFPLFSGGEKAAEHKKVKIELTKLETDRQMLAEMLEQRIRTAIRLVGTSGSRILLAQKSAKAAAKTLELVTDAYSRGAVSILDLIDAQNAQLAANLAVANARYDFLLDVFNGQRAINRLDFLTRTQEQMLLLDQFEAYLQKKGITLKKKKRK
ncbi:MAG: TolC family protein [Candidatus Aminicenantes bacterium]|nr:TolC family protein [Candidatus Aminicenantes bacterium]NIM81660.1 TolC family protein [Candidatus Aminicenantes bacterium]NIN21030.1 TolC family protein [Candidatus Aminicenantes bacterium]NIN44851.1 TolC family protein [Candidatus Aminicenantes bacterium]NIN87659.1 TolC family protein [Candidatus Aminicenantes bacterium]